MGVVMFVQEKVTKFRLHSRERGITWAARWAGREAFRRIARIRQVDLLAREVLGEFPRIRSKTAIEFVRIGQYGTIDSDRLIRAWPKHRKLFEERLRRRQICIAGFNGDSPVGYTWVSVIPVTDASLGLTIAPREDETYGFDLYTLPEYRPQLVGHELITRYLECTKELGRRQALGWVENSNQLMQITIRVVFGFRTIGRVRSVELFGKYGIIVSREVLQSNS